MLSGNRYPTRWWGVAVLAGAHLFRVEVGVAVKPLIPFGTRVMVNVYPQPRNAFLPRSLPATVFGPCETVPSGMWVYQNGKVIVKVNIQIAGLTEEEINVVKATWDQYETPVAPLAPPPTGLFDVAAADLPSKSKACTLLDATCPACVLQNRGEPVSVSHSQIWGECVEAFQPPKPMSSILPQEEDPEPAQEGLKPEEMPEPVLIRHEEVIENLGVFPDPEARFRLLANSSIAAKAGTQDIQDVLVSHPHACIAWSDESSIPWLRGFSGTEVLSDHSIAMCGGTSELGEPPDLVDSSEDDFDNDIHVCGNADPDVDTDVCSDSDFAPATRKPPCNQKCDKPASGKGTAVYFDIHSDDESKKGPPVRPKRLQRKSAIGSRSTARVLKTLIQLPNQFCSGLLQFSRVQMVRRITFQTQPFTGLPLSLISLNPIQNQ